MQQTIPHRKRLAELLAIFAGREEIPDIGQLADVDQRRLAWAVKNRIVEKQQKPWPGPLVGTCMKTW